MTRAARAEAIYNALVARGRNVDRGDVAMAAMDLDETAHRAKAEKAVRWEVWDKVTPINGVAAERILARSDYNGGEVYLIYINNRLVFLQPHAPGADGVVAMSKADVKALAQGHATELVESVFLEALTDEVAAKVADAPPQPPTPAPPARTDGRASDVVDVDSRPPNPRSARGLLRPPIRPS